jgi:hypothetical protein
MDLMDRACEADFTPLDLLSYLTGRDADGLNRDTYLDYLSFDLRKNRSNILDHFGMECYSSYYIANQISKCAPDAEVIIADGSRRQIGEIIYNQGKRPEAVFMTSMSANFPAAAAVAIALNHGRIPLIIGGIHVSAVPDDVDTYIRPFVPHPHLISIVKGAGDRKVVGSVISDIAGAVLKPEYTGLSLMEDGVWGGGNVRELPRLPLNFLKKLPVAGHFLPGLTRMNVTSPYSGCPNSCKYCSISTLPKAQRKFMPRSPEDFVRELEMVQDGGVNLKNRFFFFLPDNLMLGGDILEEMLDTIIESKLTLNYAVQTSINIADNEPLLAKLRQSGASHFFIGFESLDLRNRAYINKRAVKDIKKSGRTVSEYYAGQIQKIIDHGISIHGAFITGLPYDYFNSLEDHSGRDVAGFCIDNKIGIQPGSFCDLPGSIFFQESRLNGNALYGDPGTMAYLVALCIADLSEMNRKVPASLMHSPLVAAYMVYDTVGRVASQRNAVRSALYMAWQAWKSPTGRGRLGIWDRIFDSLGAIAFQLGVSAYKDMGEGLVFSSKGIRGTFERLYDNEKNMEVRRMFKAYIEPFKFDEFVKSPTTVIPANAGIQK